MRRILVHICCGVDAIYALQKLQEEYPDAVIEGYFYDPNIHPEEEYRLRWIETLRVCNKLGIKCHLAPYEIKHWLEAVKGLENEPERGERCSVCHDVRLEKTAQFAVENGFNSITTVLMMSPKKDFQVLKTIGEQVASKYGLEFIAVDFRKKGGVEKMNQLSKENQLYHQNYCGCMYALFQQRNGEYIKELVSFGKGRLPGSREEMLFIKTIRTYAEEMGLKCEEESFDFVGWRLISSNLKIDKQPVHHTVLYFSHSIKGILNAKVTKIKETQDKYICFLNKTNSQLWILKSDLRELPLEKPRFFTNPVFIVGKDYLTQIKEGTKLQMQLRSEFDPESRSQNLIIGDPNCESTVFYHSDTLPDGSGGFNINKIKEFLTENRNGIIRGDLCVVITGAYTAGKLGLLKLEKSFINI